MYAEHERVLERCHLVHDGDCPVHCQHQLSETRRYVVRLGHQGLQRRQLSVGLLDRRRLQILRLHPRGWELSDLQSIQVDDFMVQQ